MHKNGFTLAEVLLTLAIIGVVAALTIPAVITKVTQDQYVVGLKKAYNTLKAVQREAEQEHGPMENWNWVDTNTDFEKYFKPHFDILKDCGATSNDTCFAKQGDTKTLDGAGLTFDLNAANKYKIITSDGISILFFRRNEASLNAYKGEFYIDSNGKKGPNVIGRDIFCFDLFPLVGIKPHGVYEVTDSNLKIDSTFLNDNCSANGKGWMCATKVLAEGAMNY